MIQRQERLKTEELEGEVLIYDPEAQKTYNFNGTGAFIWSLSNGKHTLGEIIDALHEAAPGTDRDTIKSDVDSFVDKLIEHDLITLPNE